MDFEINLVPRDGLIWPLSDTNQVPYFYLGTGRFRHQWHVDPFPCYSHDADIARGVLNGIGDVFPVPYPIRLFFLPNEVASRTNGLTSGEWVNDGWDDKTNAYTNQRYNPYIILCGKRIPPMPAMTRYLTAHEFGHTVADWLAYLERPDEKHHDHTSFIQEYGRMRGMPDSDTYGGLLWHQSPGEVFANDFRILIAGIEREFWPHDGIPRPEEADGIWDFWRKWQDRICKEAKAK